MPIATVRGPYASINTNLTHLSFRWTLPLKLVIIFLAANLDPQTKNSLMPS
jgi:hypothetical protein